MDTSNTWLVSKLGNDANSGHPSSYPIVLATDAKLTIGAAVAAAANGDTIIIWPGDYNESVDASTKALNIIGIDKYTTRIIPSLVASPQNALSLESNSRVENISCIAPQSITGGNKKGIEALGKSNITIKDVYASGYHNALYIGDVADYKNLRLINSNFMSQFDVINLGGSTKGWGIFGENCVFELNHTLTGTTAAHCIRHPATGIFKHCIFSCAGTQASTSTMACTDNEGYSSKLIFDNCEFLVAAPAGRTGIVAGIRSNHASALTVLNNCLFVVSGSGASQLFDIMNSAGIIIENGCRYEKKYGTILHGGSGSIEWLQKNAPVGMSL